VDTEETQECVRDTDGVVVEPPVFGACGGFDNDCDESGTQTGSSMVCQNGVVAVVNATQDCTRDTDGVILDEEVGVCGNFADACDESGEIQTTRSVCRDGVAAVEVETENCLRDTEGVVLDPGVLGACGGFEHECDEDGVSIRNERRCTDGQSVTVEVSQDCSRETDGLTIREGEQGECQGFQGPCGQQGVAQRVDVVCQNGEMVEEVLESVECTRNTDGLIVDTGPFGECGGFDDLCDSDGERSRDVQVCRNGNPVNEVEAEVCTRNTEGEVVDFGEWGLCLGFDDECDDSGFHRRNNIVCMNGQPSNVLDEENCTRVLQNCDEVCRVDDAESNDSSGEATPTVVDIGGVEIQHLTICQQDQDWFRIEVPLGIDSIAVELEQSEQSPTLQIELLDIGELLVERNSDPGLERSIDRQNLLGGTYYVRVSPTEDPGPGGIEYTLRVAVYWSAGCPPDYHEPNDTFETAAFLGRGNTNTVLCAGEFDHFAFHADAFSTFDITARYEHDGLNEPFILLYNPAGDLHDFFVPSFDDLTLDVLAQGEVYVPGNLQGRWTVRVEGDFVGANVDYQLNLDYQEPICPNAPDPFEPNPSCAAGTILPLDLNNCAAGSPNCVCRNDQTCDAPLRCVQGRCQTGHVCGPVDDEDYYLIEVDSEQQLRVRMQYFHFDGNIELDVLAPDWQTLAGFSYNSGPDYEEVVITPTASGPYCIRVFVRGGVTANSYRLETFVTE
jgi:hypothetical protein